jgi:hypothetical protein
MNESRGPLIEKNSNYMMTFISYSRKMRRSEASIQNGERQCMKKINKLSRETS